MNNSLSTNLDETQKQSQNREAILHENKFSAKEGKEITLSDGKIAKIKDGKGLDLLNAQKKAKTSDEIPYALVAELTEIDGQFFVYEDILELPIEDVINLQAAISGKFFSPHAAQPQQTITPDVPVSPSNPNA